MTAYTVLLGIIQIAPITPSDLKWWLFAIGIALSFVTWFALASGNARSETQSAESKGQHNEIRTFFEQAAANNLIVQRELAALRPVPAAVAALTAHGYTLESPQVQQLVETARKSVATIESIVGVASASETSSAGQFVVINPTVSSNSSPPSKL